MKYAQKANNSEEDINLPLFAQPPKRRPYTQYEHSYNLREIHIYISEDIGDPELYIDMIHCFNTAGPNDVIYVHINMSGGRLDTGVQIINAIRNCEANVVTVLECMAYSLGTLILLSGHEIVINDNCLMMFHNFSGGVIGKGNEISLQLDATVKWFTGLAKQIYIPFLSEDEFNRILKGEDFWLQSPEIRKRLDRVAKGQVEKIEKPKKTPKPKTEEILP